MVLRVYTLRLAKHHQLASTHRPEVAPSTATDCANPVLSQIVWMQQSLHPFEVSVTSILPFVIDAFQKQLGNDLPTEPPPKCPLMQLVLSGLSVHVAWSMAPR